MADFDIQYPNIYTDKIKKLLTEDKGHATVFNKILYLLVNNDAFLKSVCDLAGLHMEDSDIHVTKADKIKWDTKAETSGATELQSGLMSAEDKAKLNTVRANAEENQSAFSDVKIGNSTVSANGKTAQLQFVEGENITITGDNATKKVMVSVPKLGELTVLKTSNKNNLVAAVNECFTNASSGKSAIAAAIGIQVTGNSTFAEIANEIKEEKRLVALAAGMNDVETNLREQATTIITYTHTHLPNVITNNGGKLVTGSGAAVTPASSTLDTIYHSINNLAGVKNTQINNITGERDTWYNNYVAMETDRNNWMSIAAGKPNYAIGVFTNSQYRYSLPFTPHTVIARANYLQGYSGGSENRYQVVTITSPSIKSYLHFSENWIHLASSVSESWVWNQQQAFEIVKIRANDGGRITDGNWIAIG